VAVGGGWFVLNAREARWNERPGRRGLSLTGSSDWEADTYFPMLGVSLAVLEPGEPNSMYHWETETEAFLVLSGEALLIVEGQERPLRQWDFAHCPPKTNHVIVGAGNGPCVVLAMSSREISSSGRTASTPWTRWHAVMGHRLRRRRRTQRSRTQAGRSRSRRDIATAGFRSRRTLVRYSVKR
jgi:uncharacterized cupin superfamily protein